MGYDGVSMWRGIVLVACATLSAGQGYRPLYNTIDGQIATNSQLKESYNRSEAWKRDYKLNPRSACNSTNTGSLCTAAAADSVAAYIQLVMATSPGVYSSTNSSQAGAAHLVAPPGDQQECEAAPAFAVAAAAETAMASVLRVKAQDCSISVQALYFCPSQGPPRSCSAGSDLPSTLANLQQRGPKLPTSACLPYKPDLRGNLSPLVLCQGKCNQPNQFASQGEFRPTVVSTWWEAQRSIRHSGSVVTRFDVYSDFRAFFADKRNAKAVYRPSATAKYMFGHAVVLVGYDNEKQFWLAKNSWGTGWADEGFFRVSYGVCSVLTPDIGEAYAVIWSPTNSPPVNKLPVTPASQKSGKCYWYKARPSDYLSKVAWLAGIPLEQFMLDNVDNVKDLDAVLTGTKLLLCNPNQDTVQVIGGSPAKKPTCPSVVGFTIIMSKAVKHKRIFQAIGVKDIVVLTNECLRTPTCTAVDTSGWLRFGVNPKVPESEMETLSTSIDGCSATYVISEPEMVAVVGSIGTLWSGLSLASANPVKADAHAVKALTPQYLSQVNSIRKRYKSSKMATLLASYDTDTARQLRMLSALPPRWDSRNTTDTGGRNYVQPAKDQQACGTCVAFAVVSAAETAMAAAQKVDVTGLTYSEQGLYFCSGINAQFTRTCRSGWFIRDALNALTEFGLWTSKCMPYMVPVLGETKSNDLCSKQCDSKAAGAFYSQALDNIAVVKEAITVSGSVVTAMILYPDIFGMKYKPDQVYETNPDLPKDGSYGAHAVTLVGWDDQGQYWLVKSSWGPDWPAKGMGGVFKVKYNEAVIIDPFTTFAVVWQGPGFKADVLKPLVADKSKPGCKWYTAKPGDTLVAIWRASYVPTIQQLIDDNAMTKGTDNILDPPLVGKKVLLCPKHK